MKTVQGTAGLPQDVKPSVATIGVFDGVHVGHQMLLKKVVDEARARDAKAVVVTFDRHPLELLSPPDAPQLITTLRQRAEVFEALGIDMLLVLRFDDRLRNLEPDQFVDRVLVDALGAVHLVVGENFRFGHGGAGSVEMLAELGKERGFTVEVFSLLEGAGGGDGASQPAVSSSLIRRQLADGDVEHVAEELGRPFRLEGHVVRGAGRGRGLGIPTANLDVPAKVILPKVGIYAGWMEHAGERHPAVINIGYNPTFEERDRPIVEVHALDFDGDLYGRVIGVEFTHRLRDERKFPDADSLMEEIRRDIARARDLLGVG
ncbi:MAG: bifunctional riboflavin kinase/FAD synthetase [Actinobacteria bacterium]|nr:MAG: bifunctional riboflavin kinase/FAD synthetase [Actinomycetota bacterium]